MGLTFRGQSLQHTSDPRTSAYFFDLIEGLPGHEPPRVRGEDVVAPGREGRYVGNRVNDYTEHLIEGFIRGMADTPEERALAWHEATQTILAVFAMDLAPGALVVTPGSDSYLGLTDDATIQARTIDVMPGPIISHQSYQRWSFKLEGIDGFWWDLGSS